ncbi:hypothetical protein [Sporosarcina sp. A2]|uniref:hypothetical protein n=1 Tax=Sporosarcina sp. A2 TaxID=3393449 RepID=UPI003D78F5B6
MVILWVRIFHVHSFGNTAFIISIFVILVHLTGAFLYQRTELIEYRHLITDALTKKEGIANAESIESITTGLSIHMNNQYFNMNTYLMYVTFSILIAIVFSIWEKKEKADFK